MRRCVGEGDLTLVRRALAISPLTFVLSAVEVSAAISARLHRGTIDSVQRARFLTIASLILEALLQVELTSEERQEAVSICHRFLVRSMDAIHLGTAVVAARRQRRRGNTLRFCTADLRQGRIAESLFGAPSVDLVPPL